MKKIINKEERERKENSTKRTLVIIVGVILLLSTLGYSFISFGGKNQENEKEYGGIKFSLDENGWNFEIQGIKFNTLYLPDETANISSEINLTAQDYYGKPVYFSKESEAEGIREIETNLYSIAERMQLACLDENCTEYAVKDCSIDNVIIIKRNAENESFISQKDKCITISAMPGDIARASDRFLFKIIGFV